MGRKSKKEGRGGRSQETERKGGGYPSSNSFSFSLNFSKTTAVQTKKKHYWCSFSFYSLLLFNTHWFCSKEQQLPPLGCELTTTARGDFGVFKDGKTFGDLRAAPRGAQAPRSSCSRRKKRKSRQQNRNPVVAAEQHQVFLSK